MLAFEFIDSRWTNVGQTITNLLAYVQFDLSSVNKVLDFRLCFWYVREL